MSSSNLKNRLRLVGILLMAHVLLGADCCGQDPYQNHYDILNETEMTLNISCGDVTKLGVVPGNSVECVGTGDLDVIVTPAVGETSNQTLRARFEVNCERAPDSDHGCGVWQGCNSGVIRVDAENRLSLGYN